MHISELRIIIEHDGKEGLLILKAKEANASADSMLQFTLTTTYTPPISLTNQQEGRGTEVCAVVKCSQLFGLMGCRERKQQSWLGAT